MVRDDFALVLATRQVSFTGRTAWGVQCVWKDPTGRDRKLSSLHCSMRDCRFRWRMVSFTALNTTLMFSVSTAVVKWWNRGLRGSFFTETNRSRVNFCTSARLWGSPGNCGKYHLIFVSWDWSCKRQSFSTDDLKPTSCDCSNDSSSLIALYHFGDENLCKAPGTPLPRQKNIPLAEFWGFCPDCVRPDEGTKVEQYRNSAYFE